MDVFTTYVYLGMILMLACATSRSVPFTVIPSAAKNPPAKPMPRRAWERTI